MREPRGAGCHGGEGGIRTLGTRKGSAVFKTAAFNRSATSPRPRKVPYLRCFRRTALLIERWPQAICFSFAHAPPVPVGRRVTLLAAHVGQLEVVSPGAPGTPIPGSLVAASKNEIAYFDGKISVTRDASRTVIVSERLFESRTSSPTPTASSRGKRPTEIAPATRFCAASTTSSFPGAAPPGPKRFVTPTSIYRPSCVTATGTGFDPTAIVAKRGEALPEMSCGVEKAINVPDSRFVTQAVAPSGERVSRTGLQSAGARATTARFGSASASATSIVMMAPAGRAREPAEATPS